MGISDKNLAGDVGLHIGLGLSGSYSCALGVIRASSDRGGGQWIARAETISQESHPSLMTVADVPRMARERLGQPRQMVT